MTRSEFMNYIKCEKINPIIVLDYLYSNYSWQDSIGSVTAALASFCRDLGIDVLEAMSDLRDFDGIVYYSSDCRRIIVNSKLTRNEQKYIILYLIFKFLQNYKFLYDDSFIKAGGEFLATSKLDENYNIAYDVVEPKNGFVNYNADELLPRGDNIIIFPKKIK